MRYAAKRTWPDRPPAWEQHGEAENLEAFALAFATDRGLGQGTEFEVLDKDSDDAALAAFRVTGTDPYRLAAAGAQAPGRSESLPGAAPPPFALSALGFFFYMAKIAVFIVVVMGGIMLALKYFNLTPPPG